MPIAPKPKPVRPLNEYIVYVQNGTTRGHVSFSTKKGKLFLGNEMEAKRCHNLTECANLAITFSEQESLKGKCQYMILGGSAEGLVQIKSGKC